jgi:hypothetical protein
MLIKILDQTPDKIIVEFGEPYKFSKLLLGVIILGIAVFIIFAVPVLIKINIPLLIMIVLTAIAAIIYFLLTPESSHCSFDKSEGKIAIAQKNRLQTKHLEYPLSQITDIISKSDQTNASLYLKLKSGRIICLCSNLFINLEYSQDLEQIRNFIKIGNR